MKEERRQILDMLAEGKISAADAERLMDKLAAGGEHTVTTGEEQAKGPPQKPKYFRLHVDSASGDKVNTRVPLALIRTGIKLSAVLPERVTRELSEQGVDLRGLSELDAEELNEALRELQADVDSEQGAGRTPARQLRRGRMARHRAVVRRRLGVLSRRSARSPSRTRAICWPGSRFAMDDRSDSPTAPDLEQLENEVEVTVYQASGPGGQHRNRTYSAVRMKHLPTGIVVTASDSRSQHRNRRIALQRLHAKLVEHFHRDLARKPTRKRAEVRRRERRDRQRHARKKRLRQPPTELDEG